MGRKEMSKLFTEFLTRHEWLVGPMLAGLFLFLFGLLAMLTIDVYAKLLTARREWVDWKEARKRIANAQ